MMAEALVMTCDTAHGRTARCVAEMSEEPPEGRAARSNEGTRSHEVGSSSQKVEASTVDVAAARGAPAVAPPPGRLAGLLEDTGGWREAAVRTGVGLAMSAAFGLALGARRGGGEMVAHAIGVAAAPAAILTFAVPALYIVVALFDAPVDAVGMARCAGRGTAALGMVLAGLAPLTALYAVSTEDRVWAGLAGIAALLLAGLVAVGQFRGALFEATREASLSARNALNLATLAFGALVAVAAARIWWSCVPTFGGGL